MTVIHGNKSNGAGLHEMYLQPVRPHHSAQELRWKIVLQFSSTSTGECLQNACKKPGADVNKDENHVVPALKELQF